MVQASHGDLECHQARECLGGIPGMQPGQISQIQAHEETYNNVILNFRDDAGLAAVLEVLRELTGEGVPAAGQSR